jgi:predicted nucleic acid-binding protein
MTVVVDASIAVKWLLEEPGSAAAAALLDGTRKLIAPDLLRIETAAAITRRARMKQLSADDARRICSDWLQTIDQGTVLLLPAADHMVRAVELAIQINHPLQDCLYLAVACAFDAPLVTSDPTFRDRAAPIYSQIEFISG